MVPQDIQGLKGGQVNKECQFEGISTRKQPQISQSRYPCQLRFPVLSAP